MKWALGFLHAEWTSDASLSLYPQGVGTADVEASLRPGSASHFLRRRTSCKELDVRSSKTGAPIEIEKRRAGMASMMSFHPSRFPATGNRGSLDFVALGLCLPRRPACHRRKRATAVLIA